MEAWRNTCEECGQQFVSLTGAPEDYGVRLWETTSLDVAFLHSLKDPIWDEVTALLVSIAGTATIGTEIVHAFTLALSETVDPSAAGERYYADGDIPCPNCGSRSSRFSGPSSPRFVDVPVRWVTHQRWEALAPVERRRTVERAALASLPGLRTRLRATRGARGGFAAAHRETLKGVIARLEALEEP